MLIDDYLAARLLHLTIGSAVGTSKRYPTPTTKLVHPDRRELNSTLVGRLPYC